MAAIIGHILAVFVGLSLGLIGGGGSILAVPILVYVMGVGPKEAIAISLVSVGTVSAIGAIFHGLDKRVRGDIALLFSPTAMLGAFIGAYGASLPWVSETLQLVCFTLIMILASILMIRKGHKQQQRLNEIPMPKRTTGIVANASMWKKALIPLEGLGIGVLTGFVGIGGGFAIVPALVLLTAIPMKQAIGTSLLIIAFKSVTGFLGYVGQVEMNWTLISTFTLAASMGTVGGTYLGRFINAKVLQTSFGYFILCFAVVMLFYQFSLQIA